MDFADAEDWIRAHVEPVGRIETEHERPWATVLRVPLADGGGRPDNAAYAWTLHVAVKPAPPGTDPIS